jgi:hypothetical protein
MATKGSLLARLAVAALHTENNELAQKAIDVEQKNIGNPYTWRCGHHSEGCCRVHNMKYALEIMEDELLYSRIGSHRTSEPGAHQTPCSHTGVYYAETHVCAKPSWQS